MQKQKKDEVKLEESIAVTGYWDEGEEGQG
jgi:hypothetical protein